MSMSRRRLFVIGIVMGLWLALVAQWAYGAEPDLGAPEIVQAGGIDIDVPGYSTPCMADWNADGLPDLIVGEGSGSYPAKVRMYPNVGPDRAHPQFAGFSYAQSGGADLSLTGSGCLGLLPRMVDWDRNGKMDLIIGRSQGTVAWYRNTGTTMAPAFDQWEYLQVGPPGSKTDIDVGYRAIPAVVDWNGDGRRDLVVGCLTGTIQVFINEGADDAPVFLGTLYAQDNGSNLYVSGSRSSPAIFDWDDDGRKDILTGNTNGELLYYHNVGDDNDPSFSGYARVEADGALIDLPGSPRSRPFICDWTGDGLPDVLIGSEDGKVRLYQAVPEPGTLLLLGAAAAGALARRRRRPQQL